MAPDSRFLSDSSRLISQSSESIPETQAPGFDHVFMEYRPVVYAVGLRILGTHEDAEDVTQEVFAKVWRGFRSFNHASSLKTWIYRIAVNTSLDLRRKPWIKMRPKSAPMPSETEPGTESALLVNDETAERSLLEQERRMRLSRAIGGLRPHLKSVFVLKELEEMSYEEISSTLGLSTGTISSRLNRARKALQESLRPRAGAGEFAGAAA